MRRRCHRFASGAHIALVGARQRAYGGVLNHFGNAVDGIEVAGAGGGKTGFNHVYAQFFQLAGNADFFFFGHRRAGRLLAVAQGGVEYDYAIVAGHFFFLQGGLLLHKGV